MKLLSLRTFLYFGVLVLFVGAIEFKKSSVRQDREKVVESVLGMLIEEGAPVEVKDVEVSNIEETLKVTLFQCGRRAACFYKSQAIAAQIRAGMKVFDYPDGDLIGQVEQVSRRADYNNGLFKSVVFIQNAKEAFGGERVLVGEVLLKKKRSVFTVPVEAVEGNSLKKYLWIAKDRVPTRIEIETGIQNEKEIEITKGLSGGEKVIVKGLSQAQEYNQLNIVNESSQGSQIEKEEKSRESI